MFKSGIALFEEGVVLGEVIEVFAVELGDDNIHEPAALIGAFVNELLVGWRDHDERDETYMVNEPLVVFLVFAELFFPSTLYSARNS